MTTRLRTTATYLYPGSFLPEEITLELPAPTYDAAVAFGPDYADGYFKKDGWYAVRISTSVEERYLSADKKEFWVRGEPTTTSYIVGHEVHADDIPGERFDILRANLRGNSKAPYENLGVRTRAGNWQIRSDWDVVVAP